MKKKVVVIGGGTGTFVVLKGLKQYPVDLTAVVSMSDSGGSNKRIRDEFGMLPTSDLRSCLAALSDENGKAGVLRNLFMYRFDKGEGISGMTFGNLFMAALTDIMGSQKEAIKKTHEILRVKGKIIPVTYTDTHLFAKYENGHEVGEEHFIDEPTHDGALKITQLRLEPRASANPDAIEAIKKADVLIMGPGDLFTSILPNIVIEGISEAIRESRAQKVYVMNLMTKYGQTYQFSAKDHVRTLEEYIGKPVIDNVIINTSMHPPKALALYMQSHEEPVVDDLGISEHYNVTRANVASDEVAKKNASDALVRSLIRHDPDKLATVLQEIFVS